MIIFDFLSGELISVPSPGSSAPPVGGSAEPLSDGLLPCPEVVFDDVTGDVVMEE
jgi:hypothetical protein